MYKAHDHDWLLIVEDPTGAPERGVQQCTVCLVEVARIHPLPVPVFLEYEDEPLADWERELLLERSPFGPVAAGLVRRHEQPDLTPTFQEPS